MPLGHGGVPGAIAEGTIALLVAAVLGAVWLRERRSGAGREERDPSELSDDEPE